MTDLSKQLLEKAHGGPKLNPDEQRRYLGTFEERVLGYMDISTANSSGIRTWIFLYFRKFSRKGRDTFVKISPNIEFDKQVFYLRQAKESNCQATIVSDDHITSPFGLVIHTNEPVQVEEGDLRLAFSSLWEEKKVEPPKKSIWKKWFG